MPDDNALQPLSHSKDGRNNNSMGRGGLWSRIRGSASANTYVHAREAEGDKENLYPSLSQAKGMDLAREVERDGEKENLRVDCSRGEMAGSRRDSGFDVGSEDGEGEEEEEEEARWFDANRGEGSSVVPLEIGDDEENGSKLGDESQSPFVRGARRSGGDSAST